MSAAKKRLADLETVVRERIGGAYRYGITAMAMSHSAPLGYPEENRDAEAVLAAVEAYVKACAKATRREVSARPDGEPT